MTAERDEPLERRESARRSNWIRLASIGLVVAGLTLQYRNLTAPQRVAIPMKTLEVAEGRAATPAVPASSGVLRGRNVVLVTLDTTRPDRLGCYGNRDIETPILDRLAANGVIFSNAVATAPTTLPTHASILTGLYPHHHGARTNGLYHLAEEQFTLAELLSENGYETAAFVSAFTLSERFGLAQGFDHYDDETDAASTLVGAPERRGDRTTDRAIRWLKKTRSRPFFLWVHFFDPHQAYTPPSPVAERHEYAYDGEIAFVDQQLGRLLKAVDAASEDEPLLVVTADHGEALGEHGEVSHGLFAYEATLRIPLIVHAPEALGRGHHISARVSQVDLVPTIGSLLGVEVPGQLDGVDLTRAPDPERPIVAEAVEYQANYGWAGLTALYRGPLKLVDGPRPELFDLVRDPLEKNDVFAGRQREAGVLRQQLHALRGAKARLAAPSNTGLDPDDVAKLEALGYAVTPGQQSEPRTNGPDPKEMQPILNQMYELLSNVRTDPQPAIWRRVADRIQGKFEGPADLIAALEAMTAEYPNFAPAYRYLGLFYEGQNRPADAERARERFTEIVGSTAVD